MEDDELIEIAKAARVFAYAPYSHFAVGAALLTEAGHIYQGCNVENASFGLTNCAERTAVFQAIAHGEQNFKALAICADTEKITAPCGACRQVLAEFAPEMAVIMSNLHGQRVVMKVSELLPMAFDQGQLECNDGEE